MRNDDCDDTRESGDNCKNDRKEDDHSAATKVCHDIFTENCHLTSTSMNVITICKLIAGRGVVIRTLMLELFRKKKSS